MDRIRSSCASCLATALVLVGATTTFAQNRLEIAAGTLLTGATDQEVAVRIDNAIRVLGFSFGVSYDRAKLSLVSVTNAGTVAADADYFEGRFDDASGVAGYGCVFDLDGGFVDQALEPGNDQMVAKLVFDVLATSDTTASVQFQSVAIAPNLESPVVNVLTNELGQSVTPQLAGANISIVTEAPVITAIVDGTGREGSAFQIQGQFLNRAGLVVTVCDAVAVATPSGDGTSIDVVAPACGTVECVDVVVTTERGTDTEVDGFCYEPDPAAELTGVAPAIGTRGDTVTLSGANFGEPGLTVTICGVAATVVSVSPDGSSLTATVPNAPACTPGLADVEVCNDFGCASLTGAFEYEEDEVGERFVRGDADSSGGIDLSDGVKILTYLFQGAAVPACLDGADSDDSGTLELTDAVRIFSWLFSGGQAPRPPTPSSGSYAAGDCGLDPTDSDPFDCGRLAATCS